MINIMDTNQTIPQPIMPVIYYRGEGNSDQQIRIKVKIKTLNESLTSIFHCLRLGDINDSIWAEDTVERSCPLTGNDFNIVRQGWAGPDTICAICYRHLIYHINDCIMEELHD